MINLSANVDEMFENMTNSVSSSQNFRLQLYGVSASLFYIPHVVQVQRDLLPGDLPDPYAGDGGLLPRDMEEPLGRRHHRSVHQRRI